MVTFMLSNKNIFRMNTKMYVLYDRDVEQHDQIIVHLMETSLIPAIAD